MALLATNLAYNMLMPISPAYSTPSAAVSSTENNNPRGSVLRLIESGKITSEEGANLLNALSVTKTPVAVSSTHQLALNKSRHMLICGMLIATLGFFLPWLHINGQALKQIGNIQVLMEAIPESRSFISTMNYEQSGISLTGSQLKVGWMIIIFLLISAGMTLSPTTLRETNRRLIQGASQVGAALLLIYLLTSSFSYLAFGLLIMVLGYVVQLLALSRLWNPDDVAMA